MEEPDEVKKKTAFEETQSLESENAKNSSVICDDVDAEIDTCEYELKNIDDSGDKNETKTTNCSTDSEPVCDTKETNTGNSSVNEDGDLKKRTHEKHISSEDEKFDTNPDRKLILDKERRAYLVCLTVVFLASVGTRLYNIQNPTHVCWDETHFGKMGSWYIQRTFFFDVHPPLGKMLIGLSGYLTGYDGNFPFSKPGDDFEDTRYVGMRVFCALLGAGLVPLAYAIVWRLTRSLIASLFAAAIVLFDTGTLTLSRHILLDPILLFFIMFSTFCLLQFLSYRERAFSFYWWLWMSMTGLSLACAMGVKFVGLFVILFTGYNTIADLWKYLGDMSVSFVCVIQHLAARALCLIVLPILMYMFIFAVHFKVLNHSGNGDGFYSSGFQSQLLGNRLYNVSMPEHVAYGSVISLKQRRTGGAYLHSHWHLYPEEHPPRQQQVTTYSHKDDNNLWIIKPAEREISLEEPPELVLSGDLIRLEHVMTHRLLHSHKEPAPLTKKHFQVSCYGQDGVGDSNDIWTIQVVGESPQAPIQTVRSRLQFIHYFVKCAVQSHDKKLPKWGWEQLEVSCNPNTRDSDTHWSVEEVTDDRLPSVSFEVYSPGFLEKFTESHAVMTKGNSGLKPKEGEVTSQPWQWPINMKGQVFSGKDHRIYLLGNPVLFWGNLVFVAIFLLVYFFYAVKKQRGYKTSPFLSRYNEKMFSACWWLLLAWAMHYLPFWTMSRVLYFHHYFPAFLYNAMLSGIMLDYLVMRICIMAPDSLAITVFHVCLGTITSGLAYSFYLFHPLTYGMSGPMASEEGSSMHKQRWLDTWEF